MKKNKPRFVFDANVVVSASLVENSTSAKAFYHAFDHGILLISNETLKELRDVLNRKKFDKYVSKRKRRKFLKVLTQEAELVGINTSINLCRDPDDDKYLELAIDGKASCIISGDKDLLVLNPFHSISIARPDQFLEGSKK